MRECSLSGISATPNSMHHDLHAPRGSKVLPGLPRTLIWGQSAADAPQPLDVKTASFVLQLFGTTSLRLFAFLTRFSVVLAEWEFTHPCPHALTGSGAVPLSGGVDPTGVTKKCCCGVNMSGDQGAISLACQEFGGAGFRTPDATDMSRMLYHLSYTAR